MAGVLQDRIALVTGGGQGLGQAICQRLAAEGCYVVVVDINEQTAIATAVQIAAASGRRTLGLRADVTDEAQVQAAFERTLQEFGRLDICVSNAGIVTGGAIDETTLAQWQLNVDVLSTG